MINGETDASSSGGDKSVTALKNCRHGKMLYLRGDQYIGRSLDLYGEFSELEGKLFAQILRRNDIVVEVGANIGAHTLHLGKLVGRRGCVLAFEPQRVIFQLLCANLALNELFNVRAYHYAVGRAAGTLKVPSVDYAAENNFGGLSLVNVDSGEDVQAIILDSLNLSSLRLLKIDVEGMEIDVLAGGRRLIAQHRPILYVENDRRQNSEQLIRLIEELGYGMWWHAPKLFNPDNYAKNTVNVFGEIVSANLFCTPNEMSIRIDGARKVSGPTDWWQ